MIFNKIKKASIFTLALSLFLSTGSLISNEQIIPNVAENEVQFEELNVVDSNEMYLDGNSKIVGNVLSFGPSIGEFIHYKSKKTYSSLKMEFDSALDPNLDPQWQRVVLRSEDLQRELTGNAPGGYFVALYADNYHLYKQKQKDEYFSLANEYYSEECFGEAKSNIYNGKYYHFDFRCYNVENTVHIEMYVNGKQQFAYVDAGEKGGTPNLNPGYAGFYMNSSKGRWIMKSKITDASFSPNLFLGNPDIFNISSTVTLENKKVTLAKDEAAFTSEELSITQTEFTYNASSNDDSNKLFSLASFSSKKPANSYSTVDGVITDFYTNSIKTRIGNNVIGTIDFVSQLNSDVHIKYISFYIAEKTMVCISVNGTWYSFEGTDLDKSIGYFGLYGHGDVLIKAEDQENRNYRVLFVGNSITSHAPNAALNYHIGTTTESWGMATSAPEFDYCHRTIQAIRAIPGYEDTEFMAVNVANWENDLVHYDVAGVYADAVAFGADLIVGRLGENVTSNPSAHHMEYYYDQMLNIFNSTGNAKIILTTKFWGSSNNLKDDNVDTGSINLARHNGYPLVRINDLGSTYANINEAFADEEYYHSLPGTAQGGYSWADEYDGWTSGVKQHPGMVGHENIAARVAECAVRVIKGEENASISKLEKIDDDFYVEYNTSKIEAGEPGAYDIKAVTRFSATPINDLSTFKLGKNYIPFKAYSIDTDGTPYRFQMDLQEDTTAQLSYKAYTYDSDDTTLKEIPCINNADSFIDGLLTIDGNVNKLLLLAVEYDTNKIFSGNTLSETKYSSILNFINKNNDNYTIDLNTKNYFTVNKSALSVLVSAGKDIEVKLKEGSIIISRKAFEVISMANKDITFSISKLSSDNDCRNANSVISSHPGLYGLETNNNLVSSNYEAKITYGGMNGEPLYLENGVTIKINKTLTTEEANNLAVITANLPITGSDVKNVGVLKKNQVSYEDGVISIQMKNLDLDMILALSENKETVTVTGDYKKDYKLNEPLDVNGMTITFSDLLGEKKTYAVNESMITGFDSSSVGTKTLTVNFKGASATCEINVSKKKGCGGSIIASSTLTLLVASVGSVLFVKRKNEEK